MGGVNPVSCALFLMAALVLAGVVQTIWFTTPWSRRLAIPVDGGARVRGRRVFGDNKTLRGFVVMVPATAVAFVFVAAVVGRGDPSIAGLWNLSAMEYLALGAWVGLGFMLAELPNSFVKRQLDIAPGAAPRSRLGLLCQFIADRLDSGIGMLTALAVAVPTPRLTWALVLLAGPFIHWSFSLVMFRLGIKPRPA